MTDVQISKDALVSPDGLYRYLLTRTWDEELPRIVWIMLNPSTADAVEDDMTVRKCIGFSKRNGAGGISVLNLFGLRATQPKHLLDHPDPEGPANRAVWDSTFRPPGDRRQRIHQKPIVVAAWGASAPKGLPRSTAFDAWCVNAPDWLCLGLTADGSPRHPSRIGYDRGKIIPFTGSISLR